MFLSEEAKECEAYGKLIDQRHAELVLSYLENHGGEVIVGGKGDPSKHFVEPTIVKNPSKDSALYKNEVFGPIMKILTYTSFDDVVTAINDQEKPLALYYFGASRNNPNKDRIENETSCGMLVFNEVISQAFNHNLPFGGVGYSGNGCFKGVEGFRCFSHQKAVFSKPTMNVPEFK